jgi:hypothetical protein
MDKETPRREIIILNPLWQFWGRPKRTGDMSVLVTKKQFSVYMGQFYLQNFLQICRSHPRYLRPIFKPINSGCVYLTLSYHPSW